MKHKDKKNGSKVVDTKPEKEIAMTVNETVNSDGEFVTSGEVSEVSETSVETKVSPLSKEERRALFDKIDNFDAEIKKLEAVIDGARKARALIIKEISERVGNGPFKWHGSEILIVARGDKYHLRAKNAVVEEI